MLKEVDDAYKDHPLYGLLPKRSEITVASANHIVLKRATFKSTDAPPAMSCQHYEPIRSVNAGNSFFMSFSQQVFNDPKYHPLFRHLTVNALSDNDGGVAMKRLDHDGIEPNDTDIQGAANCLGHNIYIFYESLKEWRVMRPENAGNEDNDEEEIDNLPGFYLLKKTTGFYGPVLWWDIKGDKPEATKRKAQDQHSEDDPGEETGDESVASTSTSAPKKAASKKGKKTGKQG